MDAKHNQKSHNMKTPITPLRMPLDLKAKAKEQAEKEGLKLPQWIYKLMRKELKL